ncbi:type II secretion system F family protein [Pinirhizobacter soli]|uniref:type II secretion system F family protein n=1 Tax=Pinirhizobacter soli TaxID=2786953 RepID=UPI00202A945F|nr:type II secretion system F family protein [Pinirhizobacter soli]
MSLAVVYARVADWLAKQNFDADARFDFYESVSTLLGNGRSLQEALLTMYASASEDGRQPRQTMAIVVAACLVHLRDGDAFATSLSRWAPPQECALIAAGEAAGDMQAACTAACATITDQRGLVGAVIGALAYPGVLLMALCGVLALIGYAIVPDLLREGPVQSWRGATYAMLVTGIAVQAAGPYALTLLVGLLVATAVSMPRLTGRWRDRLDEWPPWSIYRILMGTGFLLNVGTMLAAGVRLEECMLVMRNHANPYLRERLDDTLRGIRIGLTLGESLRAAEHRFPNARAVRYLVDLSGEHGFDQIVQRFARRELERSVREIARNSKVIGTVLTLLIAGACALFLLGTMGIAQAGRPTFVQ